MTYQRNAAHTGYVHAIFDPAAFRKAWDWMPTGVTRVGAIAAANGLAYVTTITTSSDNNPIVSVDALTGEFTLPRAIFSSQWSNFLQPTPYKDGLYMSAGY